MSSQENFRVAISPEYLRKLERKYMCEHARNRAVLPSFVNVNGTHEARLISIAAQGARGYIGKYGPRVILENMALGQVYWKLCLP